MISLRKSAALLTICVLLGVSFAYVFATQHQPSYHGIVLLKSADSFAYVGDFIEYQIKVYNPSDFDLYSINVTDSMLGLNDAIPYMAAGNMTGITYTFSREVLETDPNPLVNEASAEALDSEGAYSSSSTQAVTVIADRSLTITKVGPENASRGDVIEYMIMVNNTGEDDLSDVLLEDEMLGFTWQGDLNSGETNTFNLTYKVPCVPTRNLTNTAYVWAELNETTFYAEASWTTSILDPCICTRSKGYWKNHPEAWPVDWIIVGEANLSKEEALEMLWGANSRDATRMLAAQLIAAKLNRLSGACPDFHYCNETMSVDEVIEEADEFLEAHHVGSDPRCEDRQHALHLKDLLDAYNNSECC